VLHPLTALLDSPFVFYGTGEGKPGQMRGNGAVSAAETVIRGTIKDDLRNNILLPRKSSSL